MFDLNVRTRRGTFAAIDFGGPRDGVGVLLVHEAFCNAASFLHLGARMARYCRPIAVDLRGHGQTRLPLTPGWNHVDDVVAICDALGLDAPVLLGTGAHGWVVTQAVTSGRIWASALVIVDGMLALDQDEMAEFAAVTGSDEILGIMADRFALGAHVTPPERDAFLAAQVERAADDWMTEGIPGPLFRAQLERALVESPDGGWVRQPFLEDLNELLDGTSPDGNRPGRHAYERIDIPLWFVNAADGFASDARPSIETILSAHPDRRELCLPGTGGLVGAHPIAIADFLLGLVDTLPGLPTSHSRRFANTA